MLKKFCQAQVYRRGRFERLDILVDHGHIVGIQKAKSPSTKDPQTAIYDCSHLFLFPGFCDLHVHFREPGFSYKERIRTGSLAAAHGGYTCVCTMPNLKPVPDRLEHLEVQRDIIRKEAAVHVLPYASISQGEKGQALSDFQALAPYVVAFSDDGVGLASRSLMQEAMEAAKKVHRAIVAHAEEIDLVQGGVIHDGSYAARHGLAGNPSASEWKQVERDLDLALSTGARYHICHISTKESVHLLQEAQAKGGLVSGETAPHYLDLTDEDLEDSGNFRMNPPIRSGADREALRQALADGSLLAIATDHAPHSAEEKTGGLAHSLNGIVGLETAFPVLYTDLVLRSLLPLERLVEALTAGPYSLVPEDIKEAKVGPGIGRTIAEGEPADFTLFDLDAYTTISSDDFLSMGKASPFLGKVVRGVCQATLVGGEFAYRAEGFGAEGEDTAEAGAARRGTTQEASLQGACHVEF